MAENQDTGNKTMKRFNNVDNSRYWKRKGEKALRTERVQDTRRERAKRF